MNSQQAREKLEALVENSTTGVDIMAAVDVLGDARELKGHVAACEKSINFGVKDGTLSSPGHTRCGQDGYYCEEGKRLQGGNV